MVYTPLKQKSVTFPKHIMLHGIKLVTEPTSRDPSSPAERTKHSVGRNQSSKWKISHGQSVVKMIIILFCYGWQPRERSERSSQRTRSATSVCGRFLSRHELFYKSYNDEHLVPHLNSNMKKKPRYFF